jgi:hypothetical protein
MVMANISGALFLACFFFWGLDPELHDLELADQIMVMSSSINSN